MIKIIKELLSAPLEEDRFGSLMVLGFLFRKDKSEVCLLKKLKPEFAKDRLNGPGGKCEVGEDVLTAIRREFKEETNLDIDYFQPFGAMVGLKNDDISWVVTCFSAELKDENAEIKSLTEEEVGWYNVEELKNSKVMDNLHFYIPMAKYALEHKEAVFNIQFY